MIQLLHGGGKNTKVASTWKIGISDFYGSSMFSSFAWNTFVEVSASSCQHRFYSSVWSGKRESVTLSSLVSSTRFTSGEWNRQNMWYNDWFRKTAVPYDWELRYALLLTREGWAIRAACNADSCKIHPRTVLLLYMQTIYRKRSEMRTERPHPISAYSWRIYFPGMKLQECKGITVFENYCTWVT